MDPYLPFVRQWLADDESAPPKQRHTARRIYDRLVDEHGFPGAEVTVRQAVARLRGARREIYVPLEAPWGQIAQADFGGAVVTLAGVRTEVALFCLALAKPPEASAPIEDRCAERLDALFAFELGKNKAFDKVIDPDMPAHAADATPGTSDVSKLYRELMHHGLKQGWAIEFYDSRGTSGAATISRALEICRNLRLPEGKKLTVVFVGFSADGKHHVSSNDPEVEAALISRLVSAASRLGRSRRHPSARRRLRAAEAAGVRPDPAPPSRRSSQTMPTLPSASSEPAAWKSAAGSRAP